ncbi:aspartyl-phosphate phosphatase Spo0E family protein [Peptococcaceae bacterium 1198_IL3148]
MKEYAQLLIKIEKVRSKMHRLATEKGINHQHVLQVSQQLDNLLNQYNQIKYQRAYKPDTKVLYPFKLKESTVRFGSTDNCHYCYAKTVRM